jgi:hypothetical protein
LPKKAGEKQNGNKTKDGREKNCIHPNLKQRWELG